MRTTATASALRLTEKICCFRTIGIADKYLIFPYAISGNIVAIKVILIVSNPKVLAHRLIKVIDLTLKIITKLFRTNYRIFFKISFEYRSNRGGGFNWCIHHFSCLLRLCLLIRRVIARNER